MAGTPEGGKKAAEHTPEEVKSERGRKGAETLASDPQKKSTAAQKAADTLKRENPEHFREIGAEGGKQSGGGKGGKTGGGSQGGSQSQGGQGGGRGREEENE